MWWGIFFHILFSGRDRLYWCYLFFECLREFTNETIWDCCCLVFTVLKKSICLGFVATFGVRYGVDIGFPGGTVVKNLPAKTGDVGDPGLIPGSGRPLKVGNGNPLQYSCLESSMDRVVWQATVQKVVHDWAQNSTEWICLCVLPQIRASAVFMMISHMCVQFPAREVQSFSWKSQWLKLLNCYTFSLPCLLLSTSKQWTYQPLFNYIKRCDIPFRFVNLMFFYCHHMMLTQQFLVE